MAVEVFDATLTPLAGSAGHACVELRSCFNNYGAGEIERFVPGGLNIDDTYYYRVFDATGISLSSVETKVKTYADLEVTQNCFPVVSSLGHTWHIEGPCNRYNSPPVPVFFARLALTDLAGNETTVTALKNLIAEDGLEFQLGDFGPAAPGDYFVHAQNEVKMQAKGCTSSFCSH